MATLGRSNSVTQHKSHRRQCLCCSYLRSSTDPGTWHESESCPWTTGFIINEWGDRRRMDGRSRDRLRDWLGFDCGQHYSEPLREAVEPEEERRIPYHFASFPDRSRNARVNLFSCLYCRLSVSQSDMAVFDQWPHGSSRWYTPILSVESKSLDWRNPTDLLRIQVMAAMVGLAYPVALSSFVSVVSFAVYGFSGRVVLIPCALLATGMTFPLVSLAATQISKYIRDYSHLYRGKRDIREWLDFKKRNPYIFTDKSYDQREDTSGTAREQTRWVDVSLYERCLRSPFRKSSYSFNIGPDLYGILGVSRVATSATIKQAYLVKVKQFHPDRNVGDKQVEETFKLINQAYTILSDPEQRQIFDEYGYDHVKYKWLSDRIKIFVDRKAWCSS